MRNIQINTNLVYRKADFRVSHTNRKIVWATPFVINIVVARAIFQLFIGSYVAPLMLFVMIGYPFPNFDCPIITGKH